MGVEVKQVARVGTVPVFRIMVAGMLRGYAVKDTDGSLLRCETLADARRMARG